MVLTASASNNTIRQDKTQAAENNSPPPVSFDAQTMQVTFTITKKAAWDHHWDNWKRFPLRLTLRLAVVPILAYYVCRFGGLDPVLTTITVTVISIVPFASLVMALVDLLRKAAAVRTETAAVRVAEIGEFDFRLGLPGSTGHYYHWTRFQDIQDTKDCLYFVLRSGAVLRVPKIAFADPAACQVFLAEARCCWNAARLRESRQIFPSDETVWPPAPRPSNSAEPGDSP